MIDTIQWFINLNPIDAGRVVGGLLVLITVIEFLVSFRDWTSS